MLWIHGQYKNGNTHASLSYHYMTNFNVSYSIIISHLGSLAPMYHPYVTWQIQQISWINTIEMMWGSCAMPLNTSIVFSLTLKMPMCSFGNGATYAVVPHIQCLQTYACGWADWSITTFVHQSDIYFKNHHKHHHFSKIA